MKENKLRAASHAGSWYTDDGAELDTQLSSWLGAVKLDQTPVQHCKAIIGPHAGYAYSGPTAAWAYKCIDVSRINRVFILGPSHHFYLNGCGLSQCTEYDTPLGKLPLDLATIQELQSTDKFSLVSHDADESEHSIELHLPYVRKVFEGKDISIVPIIVGAINKSAEEVYGEVLAPYLAKDDTLFVISSDFCHWGTRFSYTYYYPQPAPSTTPGIKLSQSVAPSSDHHIYESISRLDHEAMDILTLPRSTTVVTVHTEFAQYLAQTKNTICGRHPIGVLLGALAKLERDEGRHASMNWVRYEQSSHCENVRDSSVSYASAWVTI